MSTRLASENNFSRVKVIKNIAHGHPKRLEMLLNMYKVFPYARKLLKTSVIFLFCTETKKAFHFFFFFQAVSTSRRLSNV